MDLREEALKEQEPSEDKGLQLQRLEPCKSDGIESNKSDKTISSEDEWQPFVKCKVSTSP